jgi:hypothetical protein
MLLLTLLPQSISKLLWIYNQHFSDRKLRLGRWILEAIILKIKFQVISGSEVETKSLDQKCEEEIHFVYSESATFVQKHVRGFLARRHSLNGGSPPGSPLLKTRQSSPESGARKPFLRKYHAQNVAAARLKKQPDTLVSTSSVPVPEQVHSPIFLSRLSSPYRGESPSTSSKPTTVGPIKPAPPQRAHLRTSAKHSPRSLKLSAPLETVAPSFPRKHIDPQRQHALFARPISPVNNSFFDPSGSESEGSQAFPTIPAVELYDRLFALDNKDLSVLITGNAHKERERCRNQAVWVRAIHTNYILSYRDARAEFDNLQPFQDCTPEGQGARFQPLIKKASLVEASLSSEIDRRNYLESVDDDPGTLAYQFEEDSLGMGQPFADQPSECLYENDLFCSHEESGDHLLSEESTDLGTSLESGYRHGLLRSDLEITAAAICLQKFVRLRQQRSQDRKRLEFSLFKISETSDPNFIQSALLLSLSSGNISLAALALQRIEDLLLAHRFPRPRGGSSFQPTNRSDMELICRTVSAFISVPEVFQIGVSLLTTVSRIVNVPFLLKQMGDCHCCELALWGLSRYVKTARMVNALLNLLDRLVVDISNRQHLFSISGCRTVIKLVSQCYAHSDNSTEAQRLLLLTQQSVVGGDKTIAANLLESNFLPSLLSLVTLSLERRNKVRIEPILRVLQAVAVQRSSSALTPLTSVETLRLLCVGLMLTKLSPGVYRELATLLLTLLRRCSSASSPLFPQFEKLSQLVIHTVAYLISGHHPALSSAKLSDEVLGCSLDLLRTISVWEPCRAEITKTNLCHFLATVDIKTRFPAYISLAVLYPPCADTSEEDAVLTHNSEELLSGVLTATLVVKLPELTELLCEDLLYTVHQVYPESTARACDTPSLLLLEEVMRQYPHHSDLQKICLACLDHLLHMMAGDVPHHPYHQLLSLVALWRSDKTLSKKYLEIVILFDERCHSFHHPIEWTIDQISSMIRLLLESLEAEEYSVLERWCYLFRGISTRFKHRLCLLHLTPIFVRILGQTEIPSSCKVSSLLILPNIYSPSCKDCFTGLCSSAQLNLYLRSIVFLSESCHEVVAFLIVILGDGSGEIRSQIHKNVFSSTFIELLDDLDRDINAARSSVTSELLLVILAFLVHCLQHIPTIRNQLIPLGVRSRLLNLQTKVDQMDHQREDWAESDFISISLVLAHCVADLPTTPLNNSEDELDQLSDLRRGDGDLKPSALLDELSQRRHSVSVTSPRFSQRVPPARVASRLNHLSKETNRLARADSHDYSSLPTDELVSGLTNSTNATFLLSCLTRCTEEHDAPFARNVLRRMETVLLEVQEKIRKKKGLEGQLHDSKIVQSIVRNFNEFIDLLRAFEDDMEVLIATILLLKRIPCDADDTDRLADEGIFPVLHSLIAKQATDLSSPSEEEERTSGASGLIIIAAEYAKQLLLHGGPEIRTFAGSAPGTGQTLISTFARLFKAPDQMKMFSHYLRELCHSCPANQSTFLRSGLGAHIAKYLIENKRDESAVQHSIRLIFSLCSPNDRNEISTRTLLSHRHLKLYLHIIRTNPFQPNISRIMCKFFMLLCTGRDETLTHELVKSKLTEDLINMIRDGVSDVERYHPDCLLHMLMLVGHIVCYFPLMRQEFRSLDLMTTLELFKPSLWNESTMAMVRMLQRLFSPPVKGNQEGAPLRPHQLEETLTSGEKEYIDAALAVVL